MSNDVDFDLTTLDPDGPPAQAEDTVESPPQEAEGDAPAEVPEPTLPPHTAPPAPTTAGRVLVYDHTDVLGPLVRSAATLLDSPPEIIECVRPNALGQFLTEYRFDLLVAGPGLDTRAGFERLRIIREELPAMSIVLVVPDADEFDVRDVVRAGAVDLVETPATLDDLARPLRRALEISRRLPTELAEAVEAARPEPSTPRRVITIGSASGGCGKTFVATNLAWFLHQHGGRRVCIIDLDLQFGEVSSALRLRPRYTITDLLQSGDEDDDLSEHFEEYCETHLPWVSVLAAPRDPTEAQLIQPSDVGRIIDAARRHFDDVIVDTPPSLVDSVVVALNRSDELLVLATLDVPSIRNLQVFLRTLERLNVSNEGIRLLLNKAVGGDSDSRRLLRFFPQGFEATLPYSSDVPRSINSGRPVLDSNPDSEISMTMGASLRRLLDPEAQTRFDEYQASRRPSRSLFGRRKKARS